MRDGLQAHRDLRVLAGQPLARAQVEGHTGPAPVRDLELDRRVGLGCRLLGNALLLEVAGHLLAARLPRAVLRAHGHVGHVVDGGRPDGTQDLHLLVPHRVGVEGHRRLHRQEHQELQHVVLDQVAQRARLVVVAGAGPDPHVLRRGDLHAVDVRPVPERLEDLVAEP